MSCGSLLALLVECASWLFAFVAACLIHCRGNGKQVAYVNHRSGTSYRSSVCLSERRRTGCPQRLWLRRYGEQIPPLPRGQFFGKMLPKFVFERRKQLQK